MGHTPFSLKTRADKSGAGFHVRKKCKAHFANGLPFLQWRSQESNSISLNFQTKIQVDKLKMVLLPKYFLRSLGEVKFYILLPLKPYIRTVFKPISIL